MEGIFHGQYTPLWFRALLDGLLCVSASDLERRFPGFGAAVGQEDAIEAGDTRQTLGDLRGELVVVQVRGVNQFRGLLRYGLQHGRVTIAERIHSNSANEIEILLTLGVVDVYTLAALQKQRNAVVGRQQKL